MSDFSCSKLSACTVYGARSTDRSDRPRRSFKLPSVRCCLSAHHNAGLRVRRAKLISANALGAGRDNQLHPDGIRTLEIRGLGRLALGVDAVLLFAGCRIGETRQLEHDP